MTQQTSEPKRRQPMNLWGLLAAAAVAHVILAFLLSPGLFFSDDDSPEALVEKARELRETGKYQQAMELYSKVVRQKPPTPAVFAVAEKEMQETRVQALNAERQASEQAARQGAAEKTDEETPADGGQPGAQSAEEPTQQPSEPLPALPSIDGDL